MAERASSQPGRNDPCPCGSGRKYKQCCLDKDETVARAAREKAAADAPAAPAEPVAQTKAPRPQDHQPWKRSATNTQGFQRRNTPRKVGGS